MVPSVYSATYGMALRLFLSLSLSIHICATRYQSKTRQCLRGRGCIHHAIHKSNLGGTVPRTRYDTPETGTGPRGRTTKRAPDPQRSGIQNIWSRPVQRRIVGICTSGPVRKSVWAIIYLCIPCTNMFIGRYAASREVRHGFQRGSVGRSPKEGRRSSFMVSARDGAASACRQATNRLPRPLPPPHHQHKYKSSEEPKNRPQRVSEPALLHKDAPLRTKGTSYATNGHV